MGETAHATVLEGREQRTAVNLRFGPTIEFEEERLRDLLSGPYFELQASVFFNVGSGNDSFGGNGAFGRSDKILRLLGEVGYDLLLEDEAPDRQVLHDRGNQKVAVFVQRDLLILEHCCEVGAF